MINFSLTEFCKLELSIFFHVATSPQLWQEHMSTIFASHNQISCSRVDDQPPAVIINCPHLAALQFVLCTCPRLKPTPQSLCELFWDPHISFRRHVSENSTACTPLLLLFIFCLFKTFVLIINVGICVLAFDHFVGLLIVSCWRSFSIYVFCQSWTSFLSG